MLELVISILAVIVFATSAGFAAALLVSLALALAFLLSGCVAVVCLVSGRRRS